MHLIRHSGTRDLRVDLFRGLALWWIYTDHIPGDALSHLSLQNYAMCDATEIFVLLAGYGGGLAYGLTMNRQGYLSALPRSPTRPAHSQRLPQVVGGGTGTGSSRA